MASLIEQIIEKTEKIPVDPSGNMLIKSSDYGLDFMNAFFANVLKQDSIQLTNAVKVPPEKEKVTVTGTAGLYGYKDLALNFTFDVKDGQVIGTVSADFPAGYQPVMPVLTWVKAGNISFVTGISEKFKLVSFDFKLSILGNDSSGKGIPVEISNQSGSEWEVKVAEGVSQGVTPAEITSLLAGQQIDKFIPSSLAAILNGFSINSLDVRYNPQLSTVSYFTVGFSVTNGWTIVDNAVVLLPGLQINLTLINPTDAAKRQTTANIIAVFQLGNVNVPIYLGASLGSTSNWVFGLQPGKTVTLPSFSSLLALAGGEDFMKSLPQGLSQIPQIKINELLVSFNATDKVLTRLQFGVETVSSWPVLPDYFEIEKMNIDFDIINLTLPASRKVYGTLYGLFKIGTDNYLMCSIEKTDENPEWTIIAGLPPGKVVNLTAIAIKLFAGKVIVPQGIPDFTFGVLQVKVVPALKSFQFDAQSDTAWHITDKISINVFKLNFTRDPNNTVTPIKGSVATSLQIGAVQVDLSASLNNTPGGGWQFDGSTKKGDPIVIGDAIAYIVSKFNVGEPPAWIRTIALQNLAVGFNSLSKNFSFQVGAKIIFTTTELDATVKFALTNNGNNSFTNTLDGTIVIKHASGKGESVFKINFITGTTDTRLNASWAAADPAAYLQLGDILGALGLEMPQIPEGLNLALKSATLMYDFSSSTLGLSVESATYGKAVFIATKNPADQKWIFFFGLSSAKVIDLANLPILDKLTFIDEGKLEITAINVNLISVTADKTLAAFIDKKIQDLLPDYKNYPQVPVDGMNGKVSFSMTVNIGGTLYPVNLVLGAEQEDMQLVSVGDDAVATKWFNIQKNFGPLYFDKIGIGYKDSRIYVLVNVAATASGLNVALNGFGISSAITTFDIAFHLDGIAITYSSGPVLISGGFMGSFKPVNLYGDILVKTSTLMIGGIGGYTEVAGKPSMFLYAVLKYPLGGPAFFFITGLAAGFGFNRRLVMPDITEVANFPFVAWAMPGGGGPSPDPTKNVEQQVKGVLADIVQKGIVAPQVGSNWLAAGISFTSFEVVNSFALLTVIFGTRFEIYLLGLSRVVIPPGSGGSSGVPPVAFAELAIKASYVDGTGLVSIDGRLTDNSYVLAKACHLTGGFAFYFWFSGDHEGDFVITLGGYNPAYPVPAHYPKVPRLGINWKVNDNLLIRGNLYFALTSNAVMAGGLLEATWESGGIKAWFIVQADFLIMWKPFHYDIVAYTDIGASFRVNLLFTTQTVTIHVGVGLHIWGPEFSGTATIHLYIISFTISFGAASPNKTRTISWQEFTKEMLPQQPAAALSSGQVNPVADVCKLTVSNGLLMQLSEKDGELNWIVNAEKFELLTDAVIPSKDWNLHNTIQPDVVIQLAPGLTAVANNVDFGVRPVGLDNASFTSTQIIEITNNTKAAAIFHATPVLKNVPKGLWQKVGFTPGGNPQVGDPLKDATLRDVLTGFSLVPFTSCPASTLPIKLQYLQYTLDQQLQHFRWNQPYVPVTDPFNGDTVQDTIMMTPATANRPLLLNAISNAGFETDKQINVDGLAAAGTYYLLSEPFMRLLGEEKN